MQTDNAKYSEAEFQQAIQSWKASIKPKLVEAAKYTAADILDTFATIVKNAEVKASSSAAQEEVAVALSQAAGMARDFAMSLRHQAEIGAGS